MAGVQSAFGNDNKLLTAMDEADPQKVNLFVALMYPDETQVDFNPNIICTAVRRRFLPGIRNARDFHSYARGLLEASDLDVVFPRELWVEALDGKEFVVGYVEISTADTTVRSMSYVTIREGCLLQFVLSFTTDEQERELRNVLDSLKFE